MVAGIPRQLCNYFIEFYPSCDVFTKAVWFLATPVGGASVAAGQHTGALQLVASEAGKESLSSSMETAY